jgi:hypothetical protein
MSNEINEAIDQLKSSPQGKCLPALLLLGSSFTNDNPEQWMVNALNRLQGIIAAKEKADLFFLIATHTCKVMTQNQLEDVFGTASPSLENIDKSLAESIQSLQDMVTEQHMQQETLTTFYIEMFDWLSRCLEEDVNSKNPSAITLLNSLKPLTQQESFH